MVETRTHKISGKIVDLDNLKRIASVFSEEYSKVGKSMYKSLRFIISCSDHTKFKDNNLGIFEDASVISSKRIEEIDFILDSPSKDKYIRLNLMHGDTYGNSLEVSGSDSYWVNGTFTRIKELVDAMKPQNIFVEKLSFALILIISVFYSLVTLYTIIPLVRFFAGKSYIDPLLLVKDDIRIAPTIWTACIIPIYETFRWVKKLWPNVEINIGPEHKFQELRVRSVIVWLLISLFIPFIINILTK